MAVYWKTYFRPVLFMGGMVYERCD